MVINISWRQPIPTNLRSHCNGDEFAATLLEKLLLRAKNTDMVEYVNNIPVFLKRGQAICGRFELARCFGLKKNEADRVRRKLNDLEEIHKQITKQKSRDCTIVTIVNYDEFVKMTKQIPNQQPIHDQTITTNKSEQSVKKNDIYINNPEGENAQSLPPLNQQSLTREQIYAICLKKHVTCEAVVRKYYEILDLIEAGEFKIEWGKSLKNILLRFIELDIQKGVMFERIEFEDMIIKDFDPSTVTGKAKFERFEAARKAGKI